MRTFKAKIISINQKNKKSDKKKKQKQYTPVELYQKAVWKGKFNYCFLLNQSWIQLTFPVATNLPLWLFVTFS